MSDQDEEECVGFYENLYKSTNKAHIKSYFDQFSRELRAIESRKKARSILNIMDSIDVDEYKLSLLSEYCSVDKLTVPGEMEKRTTQRITWRKEVFENENIPDDIDLQTITEVKSRAKLRKELKFFKYSGETPVIYDKLNNEGTLQAIPNKEVLVYVRVYSPYRTTNSSRVGKKPGTISLDNVLVIRGEQTLAVLKDKINCLSDYAVLKDCSNDPDAVETSGPSAKEVYPSCFFYIENTFYNDNRFVNSSDNSKVIRDYAKTRKLGPFKVASMEDTQINSLSVRFGFPWVYQHQGRCEHVIVFSDARLFGHDDELSHLVYPRISRIKHQQVRYCMTCGIYSARWITIQNDRLPHNPCFFCDTCFKSYNYIDGQKLGTFKAYPYPFDRDIVKFIDEDYDPSENKSKVSKK